ncbi:hypothetical protein HDU87_008234 [Geranomyces variabilis]|uniref:SET domain-containing protein n=1 Tax=Geranomyces variabilis TaxID=109894 RepID=A0AAD5TDH3_9FUNG|nr:hypothetical protein HDU87_008234 [Geranomyces variabilis]
MTRSQDPKQAFSAWLRANGAHLDSLAFKQSADGAQSRGTGVFTNSSVTLHESIPLASVPATLLVSMDLVLQAAKEGTSDSARRLASCMNGASRALAAPQTSGPGWERTTLLIFLLWGYASLVRGEEASTACGDDKQRLDATFWAPYIRILPDIGEIDTPVLWTDNAALAGLEGTELAAGVKAKRSALLREFEKLRPHLNLLDAGGGDIFTPERFAWADAVFWSRVLGLGQALREFGGQPNASSDYHLIPLVDFCNHSPDANIRWHISEDQSHVVELRSTPTKGDAPLEVPADSELFISYGDRPNAEFLFIHGFVLPDNPANVLKLSVPFLENRFLNSDEEPQEDPTLEDDDAVRTAALNSLAVKTALLKDLGIRGMLTLAQPQYPVSDSDELPDPTTIVDPTFGMLSQRAACAMAVAVLTPQDGVERTEAGKYVIGGHELRETTVPALRAALETLPHWEVLRLRVWAVLLEIVNYKLCALYEGEETWRENRDDGASAPASAARIAKVQMFREGQKTMLLAACQLLQGLQERWAELDVVCSFLSEMQN